jgi:pyruvate dehydrogenase (quinone)
MPQRLVADAIVERLEAWAVPRVFGYSGDGINSFMGALRRAGTVEFIQARHEENAAFMAVGHAKYSGGVGVVTSTQGPGAIHLLNGLYDAKLDSVPVVAIIGQQSRSVLGSGYMQEVDLLDLTKDVASAFREQVNTPEALPMVLDRAFKAALANRAPAVVIVPHDVQKMPAPELEHKHGIIATAPRWEQSASVPVADDLKSGTPGMRLRRWPNASVPASLRACWANRTWTSHCRLLQAPWDIWVPAPAARCSAGATPC